MSKNKQFLGIDVSKDFLDVYDYQGNWYQFKNEESGFKELLLITSDFYDCKEESRRLGSIEMSLSSESLCDAEIFRNFGTA